MESWSFLTNHARVLLCIAHDPDARLRDIAASLGITDRSVHGIVTDLTAAGYVIKHRDGRRNRYQIQAHLPLPEPASKEPAIGEVLALLIGNRARQQPSQSPAHLRPQQRAARSPGICARVRSPAADVRPAAHQASPLGGWPARRSSRIGRRSAMMATRPRLLVLAGRPAAECFV